MTEQQSPQDEAASALWALDPGMPREQWVKVLTAAKAAGLDFDTVRDWSAQAGNFTEDGFRDTWRSLRADGGITARTLFGMARDAGWRGDAAPAARRGAPTREPEPQRMPAWPAARAWDECEPATADHPYIARKGGSPDGLRVYPASAPRRIVAGKDVRGWLVVPAYSPAGELATLQFVSPAPGGGKLNLPGHPVAGWFTLGELKPGAVAYVCEGVGGAWAAHQADGDAALVAFGAGNQRKVAEAAKRADAHPVIVADRGKESQCERAAQDIGCAWVAMPADMADNGDLNDIMQAEGMEAVRATLEGKREAANDSAPPAAAAVRLEDFHAHMPSHAYLFVPTRELWPAASVNGRICEWPTNPNTQKRMKPSDWLDAFRAVEQMAWHPAEPELIEGRVMQINGWASHAGAKVFNLYRAPAIISGDARRADRWRAHLRTIYPAEADHIEKWLAQRVQQPGVKVNHALVLGGSQGTGKDTLLEPVRAGIGPWNWQDISPVQMLGRFNGWAKAVVVRVNEARDLGDVDRFAFYDHSKTYIAAPPDVIRVDEKNLREHYVANVMGVVITTNNRVDGLYLPADDRRHFVAWSELTRDAFSDGYWSDLWGWYEGGGIGDVVTFLRTLDLAGFDPKAPPPKTPAFWAIVQANEAPESSELRDVLEKAGDPEATTIGDIICRAETERMHDLAAELSDRRNRRSVPHKFERVGYVPVRNPSAEDGLFKIAGRRQSVYAKKSLALPQQVRAARELADRQNRDSNYASTG